MSNYLTRQQLSELIGISCRTLTRRIRKHQLDIPPRKLLGPPEQRKILQALGIRLPPEE